jgi:tungstate transport system ATP-binding protein
MYEDLPKKTDLVGSTPLNINSMLFPLQTNKLSLQYNGVHYINDITLTLEADKLTVIMGPNGAGKSLLLRLLHGLISPTKGEIQWNGTPMSDSIRKKQAMVFQRPVLLRRSVAENIDFVLKFKGRKERRDQILDDAGLLNLSKRSARSLSVGEQQRLALARALATNPNVLFLDEPTASLDPASVFAIEQIVLKAFKSGTRVIFVTHDIGQAKRLANEVLFLNRGSLEEHTPSTTFFENPLSSSAKAYLEGTILL